MDTALREMDDLRERRERQKEMVEAIVKQRDMYRTLLAQATPLPQESPQVRKTDNVAPATCYDCHCVLSTYWYLVTALSGGAHTKG